MIDTRNCNEIGKHPSCDGATMTLLLRLARIGKVRHDSSDGLGRSSLASSNHDKELHHTIIDLRTPTLNDEDILVSDRGADLHACLAIRKVSKLAFCGRSAQSSTNRLCQKGVGSPREYLDTAHDECKTGTASRSYACIRLLPDAGSTPSRIVSPQ